MYESDRGSTLSKYIHEYQEDQFKKLMVPNVRTVVLLEVRPPPPFSSVLSRLVPDCVGKETCTTGLTLYSLLPS